MNGLLPPESYSVNQQIPAGWSRRPGDFDGENPVRVKVSSDWDWESAEGDATTSVAWGDWDSDGDLDLAVGNSPGQNRVYVNTGVTLEIAASWSSSESDNTNSVAWGDWDGDGDLDLAVGNSPGQNRVYVNTGVTLETAASWGSSENDSTNSVAWGDWDNDGDLDLAAGNLDSPDRVYRNTGNALGTTADWSANDVTATFAVAWGDMNGDGALDLAVGIGEAPNRVYRNTGTTLDPTAAWTSAESDDTTSVAWGDWDSDGDLDLAVGNDVFPSGAANRVYANAGVTLETAAGWSSNDSDTTWSVAWGDWDGDGDLDLAAGNSGNQPNRVYANTLVFTLTTAWSSVENDWALDLAWGDLDGDGDLDLAVATQVGTRVYDNIGGILSDVVVWASSEPSQSVAWGDWDGDRDLDLAVGGSQNRVYRNTGQTLEPTAAWSSAEDGGLSLAWGDWDGDGDLDLAVGSNGGPNRLYLNSGSSLEVTPSWSSFETDPTYSVAWGDWDNDGDLDLAVGNQDAESRVYENTSGTLVLAWSSWSLNSGRNVAWADWDGDGYLDLFFAGPYAPVVNLNTGGSLATTHAWGGITSGHPVNSGACADFDGDGDLDVAIGSQGRNDVFYHMDRTQVTAHWVSEEEFDDTWTVEWGDWNGDGYPDLAAGNYYQPIRLYVNELLQRPMGLPESPVSPIVSRRPGNTPTAFFHSAAECLLPPVALDFVLVDEESDPARRVLVQYSTAGGGSWSPATDAGGGGLIDLAADPDGVAHLFLWDAMADGVWADDEVVLRVSVPLQASQRLPFPIQRPAMGAASPPFRVCPAADLWLALSDGVDAAVPGEGVSYALTAGNNGPNAALHAQVTATFDAALMDVTWICAGTGGGACGALSGTGDLAGTVNLPPVSSVVYTVTGTVDPEATGVLSCNAEVTSPPTFSEVDIGNNAATDDNTLTPEVDLTVGLGNNVDQVEEGESVIYLLTVSSVGPSHCPNVTVTSDFASGLDDLLWICTGTGGGSCATSGSGDVADTILLPPGSTASYAIFGTVSVASGGTLVVSATATPPAEVFEREPADNTASDSDPVVVAPPIFSDGFESGDTSQWSVSVTVSSMPRAT